MKYEIIRFNLYCNLVLVSYTPEVRPWVLGTQRSLPQFHFQSPSLLLVCPLVLLDGTLCSQLQTCSQFSVYSSTLFSLPTWSCVSPEIIGCLWTVVSVSDLVCDYFTYGQLFWYFCLLKMNYRKVRSLLMSSYRAPVTPWWPLPVLVLLSRPVTLVC